MHAETNSHLCIPFLKKTQKFSFCYLKALDPKPWGTWSEQEREQIIFLDWGCSDSKRTGDTPRGAGDTPNHPLPPSRAQRLWETLTKSNTYTTGLVWALMDWQFIHFWPVLVRWKDPKAGNAQAKPPLPSFDLRWDAVNHSSRNSCDI